ncbi:MAG TPA: SET domain-containing protein [Gammaproteobacteria bacterium]|nr:SET domain-containing protein [Gammaproteobacteria bacterium]
MDVEIRQSPIHRSGIYALRAFRAGEVVLRWDTSKKIPRGEAAEYEGRPETYLHPYDPGFLFIVQSPERFVNHSCDNNTQIVDFMDVAVRDIAIGEEITSNYETDGAGLSFVCRCGTTHCRGRIGTKSA